MLTSEDFLAKCYRHFLPRMCIREHESLKHEKMSPKGLIFSWLGRRFLNRTFSIQDDDQIVDVEEIRELLDEETKEADDE